jgi:predicted transcriptional regulator
VRTELGRYSFFSLLFPLYTRLKSKDVERHEVRTQIIGFVNENPGVYYTRLKDGLSLKNGTFDYHLQVLVREHRVKKRVHRGKLRFFPFRFTIGNLAKYAEPTRKEIDFLGFIGQRGGVRIEEISSKFDIQRQSVYPVLKRLKEKELILYFGEGVLSKQVIMLSDSGKLFLLNS